MSKRTKAALATLALATLVFSTSSALAQIAGVDFEGANQSTFDRSPDDLDLADGITVSSGTGGNVWDGWTLTRNNNNTTANGLLRNDGGANSAGATTPDFPARLEGNTTGSWSITIPDDVFLDLDRIEFDVRAATGGNGRDGFFNTSLDDPNTFLWENTNLPGRNNPNGGWLHVDVDLSDALYQDLTDQTVSFNWITNNLGPGTSAIDLDTIQVFGTAGPAVVPEPASIAIWSLIGLGLTGFGYYRVRRKK